MSIFYKKIKRIKKTPLPFQGRGLGMIFYFISFSISCIAKLLASQFSAILSYSSCQSSSVNLLELEVVIGASTV
jgi:hypothetical protein